MSAFITGSTGLCGHFILAHSADFYPQVYSLSRSKPTTPPSNATILTDSSPFENWSDIIKNLQTDQIPEVFFSALGTTKATAGGVEQRHRIDHDLNLTLAKAALQKGIKKYVMISSIGADPHSMFSYLKTKGELEQDIINLGFDQVIILQPGLLIGERTQSKFLGESVISKPFDWIRGTLLGRALMNPIRGEEVALAALKLSKKGFSGEKVVRVSGHDVYKAAYE
ncbi:hypothetical protein WICPIJ_001863 [Wickerhamomyces pijperi]|uniref:NAD(P)-binding domain-containing protein n=1 Tax=Wickerhamomyces pijperi TaxID=599730 RepID=A0A9P8QAS3_WICPI|nr:hypothetical protein WICPIJ_001863 [Wickerhamomyces pijperi]